MPPLVFSEDEAEWTLPDDAEEGASAGVGAPASAPESPSYPIRLEIVETGKKIRFDVKSSDTIGGVKAKVQGLEGIPKEDIHIFRPQQRRFRDDQTLGELGIIEESSFLFLVHTGK